MHVRIEIENNMNTHKSKMKKDGEVDLMIIYLRLIENYLIPTMSTSPPWGNGEVKKGTSGAEWG